jgi:hypothetical protein
VKTQLKISPHTFIADANTVEIWHNGELMGTITGDDRSGVRILTKHKVEVNILPLAAPFPVTVVQCLIEKD